MEEKSVVEMKDTDEYKEIMKKAEERYGCPCTGVKYGPDGNGFICMECGGEMPFVDGVATCKSCNRKGIYL